jgi:hypothetical protein
VAELAQSFYFMFAGGVVVAGKIVFFLFFWFVAIVVFGLDGGVLRIGSADVV